MIVSKRPPNANCQRLKVSDLPQTSPAIRPIVAIQTEVSIVHRPTPNGLAISLRVMLSNRTANPTTEPPAIPATITRKAVGLMLGGPPANATRKATLVADRHATMVRLFVLLFKNSAQNILIKE